MRRGISRLDPVVLFSETEYDARLVLVRGHFDTTVLFGGPALGYEDYPVFFVGGTFREEMIDFFCVGVNPVQYFRFLDRGLSELWDEKRVIGDFEMFSRDRHDVLYICIRKFIPNSVPSS
jgi:hypothetical protein